MLRAGAAETRSTWIASPSAMPSSGTKVGASFEPWHERPSTAREAVSRPAQSKQCLLNVRRYCGCSGATALALPFVSPPFRCAREAAPGR